MSPDILGTLYERFLGSTVKRTSSGVTLEQGRRARKAGGVYYTPATIVDHVVAQTIGTLLTGKTPADAARLKVLDPACGAGAFLIGAYRYLLDWHLRWYVDDGPEKHASGRNAAVRRALSRAASPQNSSSRLDDDITTAWLLTTSERMRILRNSIYGVDLDEQAAEVTKLTLLLCCLEGASSDDQLMLFPHAALSDLAGNVRCGNSLITPDIERSDAWQNMSDAEWRSTNPFDYQAGFPEVFRGRAGGFDAVIGNPPWGQKEIEKKPLLQQWIRSRFPSAAGIFDVFRPFVELAVRLTRAGGMLGQVLPDTVLLKNYEPTRRLLLEQTSLRSIDWWGMAFGDAVIDAATIVASRGPPAADHRVQVAVRDGTRVQSHTVEQRSFSANPRSMFNLYLTDERRAVLRRLDALPRLSEFFEAHEGVHSGNIRDELFVAERADESCRELIFGRDEIAPFHLQWRGRYIRLSAVPMQKSPRRYANIGQPAWHETPKVLVRRTGDHVLAAVDERGRYCSNNFFLVIPRADHPLDLYGLCALLNSEVMTALFRLVEPRKGRAFAELKIKHLSAFPLPPADRGEQIAALNNLGRQRAEAAARIRQIGVGKISADLAAEVTRLDALKEAKVRELLEVSLTDLAAISL